jgi:hypothetical protein
MNLESCNNGMQCVLSIGNDITSWAGNNIHFYYDRNNNGRMFVQCMIDGAAQNIELWNITGQFTVVFNNEGLEINNTLYAKEDYPPFRYIYDFEQVQIGSTEGAGRSTASGYHIEIKNK